MKNGPSLLEEQGSEKTPLRGLKRVEGLHGHLCLLLGGSSDSQSLSVFGPYDITYTGLRLTSYHRTL
jgi:hypothetical protein